MHKRRSILYDVKMDFSHHQALCYDKNQFTETLETRKNVLVLEELRLQKKTSWFKRWKHLEQNFVIHFCWRKMYWVFILGKKKNSTPYAREEIHTFSEFTKDLSIATMNVILQMSIRKRIAFEKNYRKNKNLRKQYKTVQNCQCSNGFYLHYGTRISNSIEHFFKWKNCSKCIPKKIYLEQLKI